MTVWTNVSHKNDDYFDSFSVFFHVSDLGMVFHYNNREEPAIARNMAKELNLQFISCHYGDDVVGFELNPSIQRYISLIEKKYGPVQQDKIPGFYFAMETNLGKEKILYAVIAANNGQELVSGFHVSNLSLLDDEQARKIMKEVDIEFYSMIQEAQVRNLRTA